MSDYQDRIDSAIDELRAWAKENPGDDPRDDGTLQELADGCVPVYTYDILQAAMDNFTLAIVEPDMECSTAIEMISANIYEDAYQKLSEAWTEIEQEIEDEEDEEDEYTPADPDKLYHASLWISVQPTGIRWFVYSDNGAINESTWYYLTFNDALKTILTVAAENGVRKLEIDWLIEESDVIKMQEWRESQQIEKMIETQNSRSIKVVKDENVN